MKKRGSFVISLDYEIHWGVFDALSLDTYGENLKNVNLVIDRLLSLCDKYQVKITFATVGMLFAGSKSTLEKYNPIEIPSYDNQKLNPFKLMSNVGVDEQNDRLHFAKSTLQKIKQNGLHEIGTHTYSHYNCLASGQTLAQFKADIIAAKEIVKPMDINVESIVFPKNQVNDDYLKVCYDNGIKSYRGTEKSAIYNTKSSPLKKKLVPLIRLGRLMDGYFNLTGHNTYNVEKLNADAAIVNLPSSRFLRPYHSKLSFLEPLKVTRITKSMKHAAKNNELFHLWWHPHNFGANMDENFKNLEQIFKAFTHLKESHNFESKTMTELTLDILNK
ncbi:MAG: polysaccharide deacetylase [Flavobacteriaceae bacterium]|nr:MAG: polysaccharide deacetylase [Flavobacteriaceae bacterium]